MVSNKKQYHFYADENLSSSIKNTCTQNRLSNSEFIRLCIETFFKKNTKNIRNKRTLEEYENPLVITKRWRKYCTRNDIKYIPFGNMRSVYATLCAEAGCVDSIVCKTMGHSGNNIKEKNYQAATLNALKFNADMLAEYIKFNYKTPEELIEKRDK